MGIGQAEELTDSRAMKSNHVRSFIGALVKEIEIQEKLLAELFPRLEAVMLPEESAKSSESEQGSPNPHRSIVSNELVALRAKLAQHNYAIRLMISRLDL